MGNLVSGDEAFSFKVQDDFMDGLSNSDLGRINDDFSPTGINKRKAIKQETYLEGASYGSSIPVKPLMIPFLARA